MRKIKDIKTLEPYIVECTFDNGEIRLLDLESCMDKDGKLSGQVFNKEVFKQVKIGINGELYWDGIAHIKGYDGIDIPCEYDICPDFVYLHSYCSA